jgi:Arc/MetJ-type ribon-helix-helix transcriptional regulator
MASQTIGFAISDEDRERLDRLVEHFGGGNRSAYLRATLKVMESLRRAERLREMQAANHGRLAERGVATADLPDLIREAYKGARE